MRAAVFKEHQEPLSIEEVDEPELDADGVIIELDACGICRSDWHGWHSSDGIASIPKGHIPGHEPAGTVIKVGSDVKTLQEGDEIGVPATLGDGVCYQCRNGHGNVCDNVMLPGFQEDHQGAFAEQMHVPAADYNAIRRPDGISMTDMAALGCRFPTAFHALAHRADIEAGDWVAIHGCGGVGLSAVQIADALGGNVVAVDLDEEKLSMAEDSGAMATVNGDEIEDVPSEIHDITDGGAHVSVDALGITETCMNSIKSLATRGQHIQIGAFSDETNPIPTGIMMGKELEFRSTVVMPPTRFEEIFRMIKNGQIDPSTLVTETVSLEDISDRFVAMSNYQTKGFSIIDTFN